MPTAPTTADQLQAITAYPVPRRTLEAIARGRSLDPDAQPAAGPESRAALGLARADLLSWLAIAPNVTQGGQSYTFSQDERDQMRREAQALYRRLADPDEARARVRYGYKGPSL